MKVSSSASAATGNPPALLEVMTRMHGRHMGLVRGGAGRAVRAALQPGNDVDALWRARLDDQLGTFVVEPLRARAASLIDHSTCCTASAIFARCFASCCNVIHIPKSSR